MAGNLCSLMAFSTGRGGRQAETLPGSNRSFTIPKRNSEYRCTSCGTIVQSIPKEQLKNRDIQCPFCGERNSLVTITRMDVPSKREGGKDYASEIVKLIKSNPNQYSKKEISRYFEIPYYKVVYIFKNMPESIAKNVRDGRK